jgi:signal transduction histidine kinase
MNAALWLKIAGYLTWLVCGVPGFLDIVAGAMRPAHALVWAIAFPLFGIVFTLSVSRPIRSRRTSLLLLAAQSLAGLALVWATRDGLAGATLVVAAAQLHDVLDTRGAIAWMVAQTAVLTALFWNMGGLTAAIVAGGAYGGFQTFAVATSWLAHSESMARLDLARTNAELTATRELLAENSRIAERLRIARDLHDTLGHHLTALSIQLEVASRLTEGQAATHIREAHAVAKLLLADVRSVVSTQRGSSQINLSQAVRALTAAPGPLQIHLEMPERLDLDDSAQAHALLRCVQEIITNTARHASAHNLWIAIGQRPGGIDLHARDDGRGVPEVCTGNGLRGMRERFEEYAGRIEFSSSAGRGFEVRGFMPRPEAA